MNAYQTFQSPFSMNHFLPSRGKSPNIESYDEYFMKKIKQKESQRRKQELSSNASKKIYSKGKSQISKSKIKGRSQKKVKKSAKQYKVDQVYASRVSQMASEISIPVNSVNISKKELAQLESKIIGEILLLREQKITALENLNRTADRKNIAIQLLKKFEVLRETQKLNEEEGIEPQPSEQKHTYGKLQGSHSYSSSQYNSRLSRKSNRPAEVINSRLSKEMNQMQNAFAEASKIKDELMKPLIQHPLLLKNNDLKAELQQLQQQLSESRGNKPKVLDQVIFYRGQNEKLNKELQRQRTKLSSIEHKRFQTFFPKDKQRIDQIRGLIEMEGQLEMRKQELEDQLLNGTIIRKAEDEIMIEELKEQNRQLLANCERIPMVRTQDSSNNQYIIMRLDQLQELVFREVENKRILEEMLGQFRQKIHNLERENQQLKMKRAGSSYFY